MRLAARLYRLQQLDLDLDARRARHDALRAALQDDTALAEAQARWEDADRAWRSTEAALRRAEDESQQVRAKLRRQEARLYSGEVTHPKELQDLQREVQSLRRRLDRLEDRAVALLLEAEQVEAAREEARRALEQARAAWQQHLRDGTRELAHLEEVIQDLEARRAELWATLPPQVQERYRTLRQRRSGRAVAGVREGSCLACGATLSTAVLQRARTSAEELVRCPTCGRILYPLD